LRRLTDCDVTHRCDTIVAMPSVNMRGLRDTVKLKTWLRQGKTVELRDRNKVIGRIVPEEEAPKAVEWPDFAGRLKDIFGDQVFNVVDDLIKDREDRF
jgi:hypothetical protein